MLSGRGTDSNYAKCGDIVEHININYQERNPVIEAGSARWPPPCIRVECNSQLDNISPQAHLQAHNSWFNSSTGNNQNSAAAE